jgi:hypothetical protein
MILRSNLNIDINLDLEWLYRADMDSVTDVSEVYAISIFNIESGNCGQLSDENMESECNTETSAALSTPTRYNHSKTELTSTVNYREIL